MPDMKQKIITIIRDISRKLYATDIAIELEYPDEKYGDFTTNVAMKLAKPLKKNPKYIAQEITSELQKSDIFSSVDVAGAGFINMTLTDDRLLESLYEKPVKSRKNKKVLVEYSDPNPFKPLHAGHLYTTLVGDAIARLVEQSGAKTIRINYGGDVGLHVAKSIWAIIKELGGEYPEKLADIPKTERPNWLGDRYVEGNNAYQDNHQSTQEIKLLNKNIYKIHEEKNHQSTFAQIYWTCREWSYDYFQQLYKKLQVTEFDEYISESSVTPLGVKTVNEQLEKGIYEKSDGAIIFDGEKYGLHTRVFINSDGLPTYETKDVGLSLTKWEKYNFDESIIITANEQSQYMQVVIKSIEQFLPEPALRTRHLTHGVVKLQGGVKMSSRKGNIVTANDILEVATEVAEKNKVTQDMRVVLAAIKYSFLKNRIGSDITYNPQESIAMEGNSGPYLQYAHARACSILSSSKLVSKEIPKGLELQKFERSLARKLSQYSEIIEKSSAELAPHYICTYLYELAQNFNRFYENSRVIDDDREATRLALVELYATKLQRGLQLLGIEAPKSM